MGETSLQCLQSPTALVDIVDDQGFRVWFGQERLLHGMAEGHCKAKASSRNPVDPGRRSCGEPFSENSDSLIELRPTELLHGQENVMR